VTKALRDLLERWKARRGDTDEDWAWLRTEEGNGRRAELEECIRELEEALRECEKPCELAGGKWENGKLVGRHSPGCQCDIDGIIR
jgi:hypothetical protein